MIRNRASRAVIMACTILALLCILPALSSSTAMASEFEGLIYVSMIGGVTEPPQDLKYYVKPNKLRIETYVNMFSKISEVKIFDYEKGKMYTIMPDDRQYFETALEAHDSDTENGGNGGQDTTDLFKPEKTDKTEILFGYTCEQWILSEGEEIEIELWVAKGFSPIKGLGGKVPIGGGDITPFKVITRVDGEEISRIEITKISERKIDDKQFARPKGYKKLSLPE